MIFVLKGMSYCLEISCFGYRGHRGVHYSVLVIYEHLMNLKIFGVAGVYYKSALDWEGLEHTF